MTKKARRMQAARTRVRPPARVSRIAALGPAAAVVVLAAGGWRLWTRLAGAAAPGTTAAGPDTGLSALRGRWQRADGGYILEIRDVAAGGAVDAAYFNPRPIRVATASASRTGSVVRIAIELRDVGYPGSTYDLTYDPAHDRLAGVYFQAAIKEAFDVSFSRLPAP